MFPKIIWRHSSEGFVTAGECYDYHTDRSSKNIQSMPNR